jgi:hypothetical protein
MGFRYDGNRPRITLKNGIVCHDSEPCRVALRAELISVGCSDVTPEVLRHLLERYDELFPKIKNIVVLQEGMA